MLCKECNEELPDGEKICLHCGAILDSENENVNVDENEDENENAIDNNNEKTHRNRDYSSYLFTFIAIFFAIVIIRLGLYGFSTIYMKTHGIEDFSIMHMKLDIIYCIIIIIQTLSYLLVPFAIKKKPLRITAFVLVSIVCIFHVISNILQIMLTMTYLH